MTYKKVVLFLLAIWSFCLLAPERIVPEAQQRVRRYIELNGRAVDFLRVINANSPDLNYIYPNKETLLTIAALGAKKTITQVLLYAGADPHLKVKNGKNVLELVNEQSDTDLYTGIRSLLRNKMYPRTAPQTEIVLR